MRKKINTPVHLTVRFPPHLNPKTQLRIAQQGHDGIDGGRRGDLLITAQIQENEFWQRKGLDIYHRYDVTYNLAREGGKASLELPSGIIDFVIPPQINGGTALRLKGRGVHNAQEKGDLYIVINLLHDKVVH